MNPRPAETRSASEAAWLSCDAWRGRVAALLVFVFSVLGVPPAARAAAALIATSVDNYPMNSASKYFTHWANGHYWVAFDHGAIPGCSFYSSPDGATWTFQGNLFAGINPVSITNQWAVRYLGNTVIAAAFNNPNTRTYRSGTLNSDGTVTWSAESAAGPNDATFPSLNLLIANGRPIMWRDDTTAGGAGALWRGNAIAGPTWTKTALNAPAMSVAGASNGVFSAGALFPTGGASPDDLIVLRATTGTPYVAGNHRLVAMKWNAGTDTYDASWYNVSTLGGGLPEDLTTEVQVNADDVNQQTFAAVRDSSGNIHAVYVNRNGDMAHYKKAVGFNNSWSRISAGINPPAENIDMVALTAAAGGNLYLFYSKSDKVIYYRSFDGAVWGAESLLQDLSATNLRNVLAPMESGVGCSVGLAFVEGAASPFNIRFTLGVGSCATLQTTEAPGSTVTVTSPGQFELRLNTTSGGSVDQFFDLAEDPGRTLNLAGGDGGGTVPARALFYDAISNGVNYDWSIGDTGNKLDLLEATTTRVRVRQESFYQNSTGTAIRPGIKGLGDHTIYGVGRHALRWQRKTTSTVTIPAAGSDLDLVAHWTAAGPLSTWVAEGQSGPLPQGAGEAFLLERSDYTATVPNVKTDFLRIMSGTWSLATGTGSGFWGPGSNLLLAYWVASGEVIPANVTQTWNFLTYFKPTNFTGFGDTAVISRSSDYRAPATPVINGGKGSQWQDANEDSSTGGDFYNESEAANVFNLDPSLGLDFNIDGTTTTRYSPFFKIRQWRSAVPPQTITVDGVTRTRDVHYKADVKPVSRAHFARILAWHSTLQSAADVTTPEVGGPGTVNGATSFAAGRYGNAAVFTAAGANVTFGSGAGNFDKTRGALEFWYLPNYAHTDGVRHVLWQTFADATHYFSFEKTAGAGNQLLFSINNGGTLTEARVASVDYRWSANDWVHLRATWDASAAPVANQVHILVNGVEPPQTGPASAYNDATMTVGTNFVGSDSTGAVSASGLIDEFHMYSGPAAPSTPMPLAAGGLTSSASEYLADPSKNFTLAFTAVNATGQGRYLYLGADSQFRGMNVVLSTAGSGVAAGAMLWEYWNGTTGAWADLKAVGGFTDQTNSFSRNGTVFWTSDPANWGPYSVNGGPDLYYVRAHLPTGASYAPAPIESRITTDILLFQNCGDVTTNSNFVFAAPVPTAVKLQSFTAAAGDSSVLLSWRTGSELDNLGFQLYRGLAENGPWTRLNASLIPGLGSSALGQAYSFRDTGLQNGTRYYYRLEDVDASSKVTSHGPVWAVPVAGAASGAPGSEPSGGGPSAKKTGASSSSCPDWVVSAYGSLAGSSTSAASLVCTRHGDPEAVSLAVVSRDARSATLELRTGGFYALHEASGKVRVFVPGFDFPDDPQAAALPFKRALVEAVVGRRAQLGGARSLEQVSFAGLVPSTLGKAEMRVSLDGTVRAGRRELRQGVAARANVELAWVLPSVFQGEVKSAVVALSPLRYDARRKQLLLSKRLLVRLLFTGREVGESGRGSFGRRQLKPSKPPATGEVLARLFTSSRGLYAAAFEDLLPGQGSMAVSQLRLERQGQAVGFHIEPASASFGPGSRLYFYADASAGSSAFSSDTAWELVHASGGVQMPLGTVAPTGVGVVSAPVGRASFEVNRIYQPGLLDARDLWLWDAAVSGATRAEPFTLAGVDASNSASAVLDVYLQGGSESGLAVDYHVRVSVNGVLVGEAQFAGKVPYRMSLSVPAGLLHEGANELGLENVGDTGVTSVVFLDRFTLGYPQLSSLGSGVFEGSWAEAGVATLAGAASGSILLDVTAADGTGGAPSWLSRFDATGGTLRFRAEAGHRYLAASQPSMLVPRVAAVAPSTLRATTNQADYLLITPRAFLAAAEPLLARRQDQGLQSRAVAFEEIADEFGHGEPSAEAIRGFLAYAYQSWARPSPRYVLLLGDASYDPRHFVASSLASPLPALWTKTSYLWTASDPLLAAVNGEDALPDLAIGRLPATTLGGGAAAGGEAARLGGLGPGAVWTGHARGGQPGSGGRVRVERARHRGELPLRAGASCCS